MARSSRRRRSSKREERKQNLLGLGLALVGVVGLSGMAYAMWWADAGRVRLDAANCPVRGPTGIHAVLIDRSDPISPLQAQRVRQEFDRMVRGARAGERFDLYVGEGDGVNVLAPSVSLCSPGRGEDANGLYQNPGLIQRAFEERFVVPLQTEAARLLEPAARSTSPILESVRAVAVSSFGGSAGSRSELRLTIVSDLVQHSALNSHFRGETDSPEDLIERKLDQTMLKIGGVLQTFEAAAASALDRQKTVAGATQGLRNVVSLLDEELSRVRAQAEAFGQASGPSQALADSLARLNGTVEEATAAIAKQQAAIEGAARLAQQSQRDLADGLGSSQGALREVEGAMARAGDQVAEGATRLGERLRETAEVVASQRDVIRETASDAARARAEIAADLTASRSALSEMQRLLADTARTVSSAVNPPSNPPSNAPADG